MRPLVLSIPFAIFWALSNFFAYGGTDAKAEFFEMHIRPLLIKNCYPCHSESRLGGLRIDSRQAMLRGGNSGPVIRPGNALGSLLIQAVSHTHERFKMPQGGKLTNQEVDALKSWVQDGAVWPETKVEMKPTTETSTYVIRRDRQDFWSFQPIGEPQIPMLPYISWPQTSIDFYILEKLEQQGLQPVGPADKRTLLRRAYFDLIGLPPTPEEGDAFLLDDSDKAFASVVDRLLASPHYGERWARHWLDLARYSDGKNGVRKDIPYPNAYRYRDWVIQAFNDDLPYDQFIKAQIAGDLLPDPDREAMLPGLGFYALAPSGDDRVDVTGRVFLGLTIACAQCHDHKYDPIPTQDFYSLQGVFESSENYEYPLVRDEVIQAYKKAKQKIEDKQAAIDDFIKRQSQQLVDILFEQTSDYMVAARKVITDRRNEVVNIAKEENLEFEILERWIDYLQHVAKEHPYLNDWDEMMVGESSLQAARLLSDAFQEKLLAVNAEKKKIEDRNYLKLGGLKGVKDEGTRQYTNLEFLDLQKWYLWRDMAGEPNKRRDVVFSGGIYYYGASEGREINRFLSSTWRAHLDRMRTQLTKLEKALPQPYPFLHGLRDSAKPKDLHIAIRGDKKNQGKVAPRRFLHILSQGEPQRFTQGSGRLELAKAIVDARNPLTARVIVNRVWQYHFGYGLVKTPSNFGQLGARPTHPELLDHLSRSFMENGWSIKWLHRQIMLSATYQLSSRLNLENFERDPENQFYWRASLRTRLDAEVLRDSMLAVSGLLDSMIGGVPIALDQDNHRRTIYGLVSRTEPDRTLTLFDFPDPNSTRAKRAVTLGPMQRLYFLNNTFVLTQAKALATRLEEESRGDNKQARIKRAYQLLFGRLPTKSEIVLGLEFLSTEEQNDNSNTWSQYSQALLASSEFSSVN